MPRALDILTASQAKIPLMAESKSIYTPERIKGNPKLPATNVKFLWSFAFILKVHANCLLLHDISVY